MKKYNFHFPTDILIIQLGVVNYIMVAKHQMKALPENGLSMIAFMKEDTRQK